MTVTEARLREALYKERGPWPPCDPPQTHRYVDVGWPANSRRLVCYRCGKERVE